MSKKKKTHRGKKRKPRQPQPDSGNDMYFVVNGSRHQPKHKYVSHKGLDMAFPEAQRLSNRHRDQEMYVYEAKAIGKIVGGKAVPLEGQK